MARKEVIKPIINADDDRGVIIVKAEPQALEVNFRETCLLVIDMQNAFATPGGMLHLWCGDVSIQQKIIQPIKDIVALLRGKGCKIIYTVHRYSPDMHETGGPSLSGWYKGREIYDYVENPGWRDRMLARGTWGAEIVQELKPEEEDVVIEKSRYSAFFETNLDTILRSFGARYLIFVGLTTNGCIDSSVRDAYYRGYFPIVISDGTGAYPPHLHEPVLYNIRLCLGWVTTVENIASAVGSLQCSGKKDGFTEWGNWRIRRG